MLPSPRPRLVLITGAPGAGKTTLAARLGSQLHLPVLSRDALKEQLAAARGPPAVVVHCGTDPVVALRRFERRLGRGERHRSHRDAEHLGRLASVPGYWDPYREPPDLGVPLMRVDTTDGYTPTLGEIAAFARDRHGSAERHGG